MCVLRLITMRSDHVCSIPSPKSCLAKNKTKIPTKRLFFVVVVFFLCVFCYSVVGLFDFVSVFYSLFVKQTSLRELFENF